MTDFDTNNNLHGTEPGAEEHRAPREPDWDTVPAAPTEDSGFYRGRREESAPEEPAYRDVHYTTAGESPRVSPRGEKTEKKARRGVPGFAVAALCALFLFLGIGGTYLAFTADKSADEETTLPTETMAPDEKPERSPTLSAVPNTGDALSAGEIYEIACTQTVGVTTEITTNVFGQTTSNAVSGSGFVVTADGYILTNYHVVEYAAEGGYPISVKFYDGSTYSAKIVGAEPANDLAVLKIEADRELNPVTLGDSSTMRVGDDVFAVGNPLGELTYTMTDGMVSALDREIVTDDSGDAINMFQISAAVNSGNSGGPVYNAHGEVIGIVTAKYSDTGVEGLGFAIPISDAVDIANDLIAYGYVTGKPYMGVTVTTVDAAVAEYYNLVEGAYIYALDADGAAAAAGLQMGDIITGLDGTPITTSSELIAAMKDYKAGDVVTLDVYRAGAGFQVQVTLAERRNESAETEAQNPDEQMPYTYNEAVPDEAVPVPGGSIFPNFGN